MLLKKIFFFNLEAGYAQSILGKLDLLSIVLVFLYGFASFIQNRSYKKREKSRHTKFDPISLVLLSLTVFAFVASLYLNLSKISLHWDAVALYDARAKFLVNGTTFSEMPSLSEFDNLNKYYYLLYPPYTSIGHYFWNQLPYLSNFPVGVYYSIALFLLLGSIYFLTKNTLGIRGSLFLIFLVASNSSIFNIATKEYTNLPYTMHIVAGIFLLFSYLNTKERWKLLYGFLIVSTSIWIRLLEPIWLPTIIAFGIVLFDRKAIFRKMPTIVVFIILSLIQYFSWSYFIKVISNNPTAIEISKYGLVEPFLGILTGSFWKVSLVFAEAWGIPLFIHLLALFALILRWEYTIKNKDLVFLASFVILSILLYLAELYVLAFQVDWWNIVAKSLDRSSTFLIPISGYILIRMIVSSRVLNK